MLQVNLLPWREWQRQQRLSNVLCVTVAAITLIALLATYWRWYLHDDIATQKRTLAALVSQQQALVQQKNRVDKAEDALLAAQQRREQSLQQYRRSLRYLNLLQTVSRAIPDEVWLTQLYEHDGKVKLSGQSQNYLQLLAFSQHLKSFGLLEHLVLNDVSQLPTQQLRFVMRASMGEQDSPLLGEFTPRNIVDKNIVDKNIADKKERLYARILSP